VDGAIHRAGGEAILAECRELRRTLYPAGLPTGEAVATTAGDLPARHVIHTVGPVYGQHGGREAELLAACYRNSLAVAAGLKLASIAFPAISTGAYGYPRETAARVASEAVAKFLTRDSATSDERDEPSDTIREVRFVFFSQPDAEVFLRNQSFDSFQF
jgi:O-acetyl-ADP-ribose deacetylase (regulator of RNase III)